MYHIRQGFTGEKWQDMVNFTARPLEVCGVLRVTQCMMISTPTLYILVLMCASVNFISMYLPVINNVVGRTSTLHAVKSIGRVVHQAACL